MIKSSPYYPFGKLTARKFLRDYWQKKPLLVRRAFPDFPRLVSPDELAGLSCEQQIMSRIILERAGKNPWEVKRGPFSVKTFRSLPKKRWTLLVNGVDQHIPAVHSLLDSFRFVPNWRIDDVMISYAADRGGVGAHIDNYDVFLIQAEGRREWQIHTAPVLDDDFIPNRAVRQLRRFKPNRKWILEPGDMLYLPPRIPHNGIARGDGCMTYSIGFRAPGVSELIDNSVSFAMSRVNEEERFGDPELTLQHPGEISAGALKKVREILSRASLEDEEFVDWFGCYVTEPKDENVEYGVETSVSSAKLRQYLLNDLVLRRAEGVRAAYIKHKKEVRLFVNGQIFDCGKDLALAQLLSSGVRIEAKGFQWRKSRLEILAALVNGGLYYFDI